jgi:hypothetical protein
MLFSLVHLIGGLTIRGYVSIVELGFGTVFQFSADTTTFVPSIPSAHHTETRISNYSIHKLMRMLHRVGGVAHLLSL